MFAGTQSNSSFQLEGIRKQDACGTLRVNIPLEGIRKQDACGTLRVNFPIEGIRKQDACGTLVNLGQDARSAPAGLRSFDFGFAHFEAFDTQVSAASQNTNQFSKSSQSMLKFQPCRV